MDSPFVTILANGLQPESSSSPSESIRDSLLSTPPPRTHNTTYSMYHMNELREFASTLEKAANGVFPNSTGTHSRYQDVHVVLMRWEDDNRLGVSCEVEDLCKVFANDYGFKTTTWLIPTNNPLANIMGKSLALIHDSGHENNLLITYYGGHAAMNDARQQVWFRTGKSNEGCLEWFAVQPLFMNAKADVLFLLDCCSAASAAASPSSIFGIKETIAACGFEARAPEPGGHSFTNVLIEVLEDWKSRPLFSAAMLHSELLARLRHPKPKRDMFGKIVESRRSPVYVVTTSNAKAVSVELARRPSPDTRAASTAQPRSLKRKRSPEFMPTKSTRPSNKSQKSLLPRFQDETSSGSPEANKYDVDKRNQVLPEGDLTIPHVLVSVALEGEQLLDFRAWNQWVQDCPALVNYARIEGIYKSHSTLLIFSLPVVIWDFIPDDLACTFIGYVESVNHARELTWQDNSDLRRWLKDEKESGHNDLSRGEGTNSSNLIDLEAPSETSPSRPQKLREVLPKLRSESPLATWGSLYSTARAAEVTTPPDPTARDGLSRPSTATRRPPEAQTWEQLIDDSKNVLSTGEGCEKPTAEGDDHQRQEGSAELVNETSEQSITSIPEPSDQQNKNKADDSKEDKTSHSKEWIEEKRQAYETINNLRYLQSQFADEIHMLKYRVNLLELILEYHSGMRVGARVDTISGDFTIAGFPVYMTQQHTSSYGAQSQRIEPVPTLTQLRDTWEHERQQHRKLSKRVDEKRREIQHGMRRERAPVTSARSPAGSAASATSFISLGRLLSPEHSDGD